MKSITTLIALAAIATSLITISLSTDAAKIAEKEGLANRAWAVHDMKRPAPKVITPGDATAAPPSDAIVLFDGKNLDKWTGKNNKASWKVENGYAEVNGTGSIRTRDQFGSCQLHIEFATPSKVSGNSQGRGNSGVYLMGMYEVQILDSFKNRTYADGQCASVYGQNPPLVNASKKPGEWQTYDIIFKRPLFKNGKVVRPATVTVLHNGVLVQDHFKIWGQAAHKRVATYRPHGPKGPLSLQDHGNPIRFRNIWIRPLKD